MRPHYHRDYYAAFLVDPAGNRVEAVCHTSSPNLSAATSHPDCSNTARALWCRLRPAHDASGDLAHVPNAANIGARVGSACVRACAFANIAPTRDAFLPLPLHLAVRDLLAEADRTGDATRRAAVLPR
ncbi:hypothetical protein SAMN05445850_2536 [Paraburkholderia tuberum]|uniref:Glyoxalase/Bleomycin resistance protein/Dioxygenase superfamily protein n=1 Tax=Paraburkholderia tuberum TaxID=157910 RepID=A0A1H1FSJ9_9BURK|nr:hypothetical protein SAMN05445850_2536 [Paraburkholderia tuberum]